MMASLPVLPEFQKAQVVTSFGKAPTLQTIPVPTEIGPDEVLVNIKYSGVCHTDLHAMNGDWPIKPILPLVGGHEGAGQVVRVGPAVRDLQVGDWVGVKWINGTCHNCTFCHSADEPLCQKAQISGYTVPGTFSEYVVAQGATVARIPDAALPLKPEVAPILCAGITVYKGLKESNAKPGQSVAIVGAGGGLGSLAIQYAKAMGLRPIAIDTGAEKRRVCLEEVGAETFVDFMDPGEGGIVEAVRKAAGGDGLGPHAVLLVAVSEKPFQQATEYVRPKGTVICIGLPANAYFKAPIFDTVVRMITLKGSYVGTRQDTAEALDFFARGLIKIPINVVGLSQLTEVYDKMEKGEIAGRYVIDVSK